ncbi:hypothetical protein GOP47_0003212 [Adiantum capillus-veneris]|uniref:Uncharacterized protein n=1 Tax=Adiantum capillus-veneris TaxID=13818 RepID=A0A9D4ZPV9_ADICA|nr:hypothetical protein GOP47_0003212 [Adiantum capillus-veneris]
MLASTVQGRVNKAMGGLAGLAGSPWICVINAEAEEEEIGCWISPPAPHGREKRSVVHVLNATFVCPEPASTAKAGGSTNCGADSARDLEQGGVGQQRERVGGLASSTRSKTWRVQRT